MMGNTLIPRRLKIHLYVDKKERDIKCLCISAPIGANSTACIEFNVFNVKYSILLIQHFKGNTDVLERIDIVKKTNGYKQTMPYDVKNLDIPDEIIKILLRIIDGEPYILPKIIPDNGFFDDYTSSGGMVARHMRGIFARP